MTAPDHRRIHDRDCVNLNPATNVMNLCAEAMLSAAAFGARYAEICVPSGAIANLYAFMATCEPGDTVIAPPVSIGGHVTPTAPGQRACTGSARVPAPAAADGYTVDVDALRVLAHQVPPRLIASAPASTSISAPRHGRARDR